MYFNKVEESLKNDTSKRNNMFENNQIGSDTIDKDEDSIEMEKMLMILTYEILL